MNYTYLMYDENLYKIGKSINPEKRLTQLRTANPKVNMIAFAPFSVVTELELHQIYSKNRVSGEWFHLSEIQVDSILKRMNSKRCEIEINRTVKSQLTKQKKQQRKDTFIMPYGKYKGILINEVKDFEYLSWLGREIELRLSNYERKRSIIYNCIKLRTHELIYENL